MTSLVNKIIEGESNGDSFGHAVSLSSDGSIVAISAPNNEGDLTTVSTLIGSISSNTNIYYQIAGDLDWSKAGLYSRLFAESNDIDIQSYDWKFRTDLRQDPITPYSENPYVDVVEFSNLSTGGKNIFGVIFDNVNGVLIYT